jgi:hypothetical protein
MKINLVTAVLLLFGVSFANANECINKRMINSWEAKGNDRIILRESRKKQWDVTTFVCHDLRWAQGLAFDTRPRGSSWVCEGDSIIPLDGFGRPRSNFPCTIRTIKRIP